MLSALYSIARPCVRPSVCPSHGWIGQKRLKLRLYNLHTVAPSLHFFVRISFIWNFDGFPKRGAKQMRGVENKPFSTFMRQYLENVNRVHNYYSISD